MDDPSRATRARWIAAARKAGVAVASIHDLGLGCLDADLLIDGSVAPGRAHRRRGAATGPAYAILDPDLAASAPAPVRPPSRRGGARRRPAREWRARLPEKSARRAPAVGVRVVGGFVSGAPPREVGAAPANVVWIGPSTDLRG